MATRDPVVDAERRRYVDRVRALAQSIAMERNNIADAEQRIIQASKDLEQAKTRLALESGKLVTEAQRIGLTGVRTGAKAVDGKVIDALVDLVGHTPMAWGAAAPALPPPSLGAPPMPMYPPR